MYPREDRVIANSRGGGRRSGQPAKVVGDTSTRKVDTMAWEISISNEGWQEIRKELELWPRQRLINAISDDEYERVERIVNDNGLDDIPANIPAIASNSLRFRLAYDSDDALVDQAINLIEENNTCDNGGYAYWIDREGAHKVTLPDRQP